MTSIKAVLFDRDDTLIVNVPYNGDPALVQPMPAAVDAVHRLRELGIPTGVISNQSGIGRGLITPQQVLEVNARVDEIFEPFDVWRICPHTPEEECACRKPNPTMLLTAAVQLGVDVKETVFIGDIGADVEAAKAAGSRGILVPTPATLISEIEAAEHVASDLSEAIDELLDAK